MSTEIIRTEHLTKCYGAFHAVSDVSLHVHKGEIYGFLGLNGAGKTTTIRMLLGMVRPSSGKAWLNDQLVDSGASALWQNVGALVEVPYPYPELTVRENLEIFRRLHGLDNKDVVSQIMDQLRLTSYADRKARNLSLGNKQRLGLAKALIHQPSILILDEPTNGLDPAGIYEIRELLKDLAQNYGVTIFISSHILGEVARFASRIGIIHEGKLIREFNTGELRSLSRKRLVVNTRDQHRVAQILTDRGMQFSVDPQNQYLITDPGVIAHPESVAQLLVESGCPPVALKVEEEDLEGVFLRTIGVKTGAI